MLEVRWQAMLTHQIKEHFYTVLKTHDILTFVVLSRGWGRENLAKGPKTL